MYWSKLILILLSTFLLANNDELILDALLNENKNSEISSKAYEKLYNNTKNKAYLEGAIKQGLVANLNIDNLIKELEIIDNENILLTKVKIIKLVEKKDYKKLIKIYYEYIKNNEDLSLSVAVQEQLINDNLNEKAYIISKDYYKKYNNLYSLYIYLQRLITMKKYQEVIKLTDDMYKEALKNNKIEKEFIPYFQLRLVALKELKQYEKLIKLEPKTVVEYLNKLLSNKKYNEIIDITKNIENNKENAIFLAFKAQAMVERLKKSDTKELIKLSNLLYNYTNEKTFIYTLAQFLIHFKNEKELEKLINIDELLKQNILHELKRYKELSKILYENAIKTNDNKMLIDSYIFEMLDNPKTFDYFKLDELVAKGGFDANSFNNYAYTIIDDRINIKKGIELAKKGLELEPSNVFLIDTLAWGYYLLNDCKNAKEIFNKIPKNHSIFKEKDVILHKKRIEKCKI
ncbi:hypothetical protein [Campylobacter sp. MG1]|uniref:hypothetical protein n=1 Tax=Campylobacter sp. MG1 TaxID=2976332 RepID=UPI00226C8D93|nr:hypothetical protein [Campylobacter sp. MG1]